MKSTPVFRVDKDSNPPSVIIQCSNCEKDIRKMRMDEEIAVTRGYYCEDCDDGAIHLNPATTE